jgi:hypothetical protein
MNFSKEGIEGLERAGLLHDIGKVSIHSDILTKAGGLTAEEWNEIKQFLSGFDICFRGDIRVKETIRDTICPRSCRSICWIRHVCIRLSGGY